MGLFVAMRPMIPLFYIGYNHLINICIRNPEQRDSKSGHDPDKLDNTKLKNELQKVSQHPC